MVGGRPGVHLDVDKLASLLTTVKAAVQGIFFLGGEASSFFAAVQPVLAPVHDLKLYILNCIY